MLETISEELKAGYMFTPEQVSGRWKSLRRAYKSAKAHNAKSGNSSKICQFEKELDEILAKDPVMNPEKTMSSAKSSSESCEESEKTIPPKKKSKSGSQQMVQIFSKLC